MNRTPTEVADELRCDNKKVYTLISLGELEAFNIALPGSTRKRWVIPSESVEAYLKRHSNLTDEARAQRRRRIRRTDPYADVLS